MRFACRSLLIAGLSLAAATTLTILALAAPAPAPTRPITAAESERFFETSVRPIFATRCQSCHGATQQSAGLRLDSREALLRGGASGPAVTPGKPERSLLWQALTYEHKVKMPPGGKLPDRQAQDVSRWIAAGAAWPAIAAPVGPRRADASHWAFQPVRRPAIPAVKDRAWVKTPVDAFILAELEAKALKPASRADKPTLIRRATFDLTGLPPTPEEIDAFLSDRSPDAFAKVVDRLLASPAYGERWGRHWLDVARYADSNGLDENVAHGNAWRYRDWVIRCLNDDKPYDQFVVEQLAGDLLPTDDMATRHGRLIATGFLSLGPKVLAEADKEKMVLDIVDEQIDTTGRAFMGLTLGCARCHDHKFDPISSEDYYALAGIFKSTKSMESLVTIAKWWENPIPTPQDLAAKAAYEKRVAEVNAEITAVVTAATAGLPAPLPKEPEAAFKPETKEKLKALRERLAAVQKEAPEMPSAMGVTEGEPVDVPVLIRGDYSNPGKVVARRFPTVLAANSQPELQPKESGRLELAKWIAGPTNPLTARVMVNRVWRWHFGRGIVASTDNFGFLGGKPSNPALLDWLASSFTAPEDAGGMGWKLTTLHRTLMLSSAYQMASASSNPPASDPENGLFSRFNLQRLDAEELRDSLLSVSGTLDRAMGGSLLQVKNREFFFDHTSKDNTKYDSKRRSIYLPVVRNHVYDVFQLFDFVDPAVLDSNRSATTVAPQALFWLNSDLVMDASQALADGVLKRSDLDDAGRIRLLHLKLYGRTATEAEITRGRTALNKLGAASRETDPKKRLAQAWSWYCQSLLGANEFIYLK